MTKTINGFRNFQTFMIVSFMENFSEKNYKLFRAMATCVKDSLILPKEEQISILAEHYLEFFLQLSPAIFDEGVEHVGTWRKKFEYCSKVDWIEIAEHFWED